MSTFGSILGQLRDLGFYEFMLPWLLALAIMYGLLTLIKDKEKKPVFDKNVRAIISIVIAFFLVNYTPYGYMTNFLEVFFTGFFAPAVIIISVILVFVIMVELVGVDVTGKIGKSWVTIFGILFIIILLFIGAGGAAMFGGAGISISDSTWPILFVIITMIFAVVFLFREGDKAPSGG